MKPDIADIPQPKPDPPAQANGAIATVAKRLALPASAGRLADLLFVVLIMLMLTAPSWRESVFSRLTLMHFPMVGGTPVSIGLLTFLPPAFMASWALYMAAVWRLGKLTPWQWGRQGVVAPLLLLTIAGIVSLRLSTPFSAFVQISALVIFWTICFYLLNRRANVVPALCVVVLVQATVAVAQFLRQGDLGLSPLGELPLDPMWSGISVFFARDQRWLRGYGLTAHPNQLGAVLTALLLLLLPALKRAIGRRRLVFTAVYAAGLLGLLASFSRASILAFIIGSLTWILLERRRDPANWSLPSPGTVVRSRVFLMSVALSTVVLLLYGDLALSRILTLDSEVEATSLSQRASDWNLAIQLIEASPFRGAGLGRYAIAAVALSPFAAVVHSVPLLVTAELGLGGLLMLLWLALAGLRSRPAAVAVWIAVIVIGVFDLTLWPTGNWQTSALFAFVIANLSRDVTLPDPKPV